MTGVEWGMELESNLDSGLESEWLGLTELQEDGVDEPELEEPGLDLELGDSRVGIGVGVAEWAGP